MDTAYNLRTEEVVDATLIDNCARYQNVRKEEWVLDLDHVENIEDINLAEDMKLEKIPVEFISEKVYERHKPRYKKVICSPYFKLKKGDSDKYNINLIPESKEHKLAKQFFYNNIKYNEENINLIYSVIGKKEKELVIKLSDLEIDLEKIAYEKSIKSLSKTNRIDLYVPFKKKHNLLGYGLLFEIQFSKQNKKQTQSRNYQRCLKGFSTIWISPNEVEIDGNSVILKTNKLKVDTYAELLTSYERKIENNIKELVENQYELINREYSKINEKINSALWDSFKIPNCKECDGYLTYNDRYKFWGCTNYKKGCKFSVSDKKND